MPINEKQKLLCDISYGNVKLATPKKQPLYFLFFCADELANTTKKRYILMTETKCEKVVKHNSFLKAKTPSPSQIRFVTLREVKEIRNSIDAAV